MVVCGYMSVSLISPNVKKKKVRANDVIVRIRGMGVCVCLRLYTQQKFVCTAMV